MNELKPCPFCGGEAKEQERSECVGHGCYATFAYVKCESCGAKGAEYSDWEISDNEIRASFARRAWNRRAEDGK